MNIVGSDKLKWYKLITLMFLTMIIFTSCISEKSTIKDNVENIPNKMEEKIEEDHNYKIYKNETYNFTVEYPENWKTLEAETYEGNEEYEASPDGGISIYVENDETEKIYIFGQSGKIAAETPNCEKKEFTTDNGTKGVLFITEDNNRYMIHLVLDEGFYGAALNLSKDCYNKNKDKIIRILKSIRIL